MRKRDWKGKAKICLLYLLKNTLKVDRGDGEWNETENQLKEIIVGTLHTKKNYEAGFEFFSLSTAG